MAWAVLMTMKRLCWLLFLLVPLAVWGDQTVTLAWDRSPSADATGYNIYYGAHTGAYTNRVNVGNVSTVSVSGLKEGVTYYFAATAYNSSGLESDFSNEVSYTVPTTRPLSASDTKAVDYRDMKAEDAGP